MSRLRANQITNENANGAPNFPHGITVTGVVTATTSATSMSQIVVGSAVTANSNGVDTVGIVTAGTFKDKAGGTFAPNPTTTRGDLIVRGVSVNERLAIGSAGQFVKVNSGANGLEYGTVVTNFTNSAIFQYSHNSSFRSYSGEISFSGNPDNVQLQFNMVYDAGDILASSGSNYFAVNATGYYVAQVHWTSHLPAHFRWPYLYNRTNSKAVGAPPTGNAMNSLTTSQHGMVCYQTGQGGGSTFGEPYYLETGKDYDWRYTSDGNENNFGTGTSRLSGSYSGNGSVTQQNVVFRAQLTQMGV